jgi:2-hydroxychromene-2-carboxylate isomerase
MATIDYYITLNSPWTYMGAARFAEIVQRHGATVNVKPTKFAEVFAKTGGLPLAKRSPERQAYRMMEMKRWRDHLKMPINVTPKFFPADESAGVRLVIAAGKQGKDALRLATEISRSQWEREEDMSQTAVLEAAARRAGLDAAALRADGPDDAALDAIWDANTAEALSRGVFGAPSYVLQTGEILWGQDRIEFLDRALGKAS